MTHDPRAFGAILQRLIRREDLSRAESAAAMAEVLSGAPCDLHQGAFLASLVAKGETADEIAGCCDAVIEHDTVRVTSPLPEPLVENSGTGMDRLKTFNISTLAALVAAADGVSLARHGARALTSSCGTVDLCEALGVDVEAPVERVAMSVRRCGLGLFNGMSPQVHPRALFRILGQIRFGSTLNIAASLASPARATHGVRGVYSPALIAPTAQVMRGLGYRAGLVLHGCAPDGSPGSDEATACGPIRFLRFAQGMADEQGEISATDLGLPPALPADLAPLGDVTREARRAVTLLSGRGVPRQTDAVALNAGAILWIVGRCPSWHAGFERAQTLLAQGAGLVRLRLWVSEQGGLDGQAKLEQLMAATDFIGGGTASTSA